MNSNIADLKGKKKFFFNISIRLYNFLFINVKKRGIKFNYLFIVYLKTLSITLSNGIKTKNETKFE
jgi:hypothetical protein